MTTTHLSNRAILEYHDLLQQAQQLTRGNSAQRAEAIVLQDKARMILKSGLSSQEARECYTDALVDETRPHCSPAAYERAFCRWLRAGDETELAALFQNAPSRREGGIERRDLLAGQQTITWTQGPAGGYVIPLRFKPDYVAGEKQVTPLLSDQVTNYEMTDSPILQPEIVSGFDLTSVAASQIGEATQQLGGTVPSAAGGHVLRANIVFKISFLASFEAEADVYKPVAKLVRAAGVGFARKIGRDALNGDGVNQMGGLLTALNAIGSVATNATAGKLVLDDLLAIYFSVDRLHRNAPKCVWLMHDSVYKYVLAARDSANRPLLSVDDDREMLLGKPVLVAPDMPAVVTSANPSIAQTGQIIFGDLDHFLIRCSQPTIQRAINAPNTVEYGKALFIGRMRADSFYFDPSAGAVPPIVVANVQ